jgi:hypothetical protein
MLLPIKKVIASSATFVVVSAVSVTQPPAVEARCGQGWKVPAAGANYCVPANPRDYAIWKECGAETKSYFDAGMISGMAAKNYTAYCTQAKSTSGLI